MKTFTAALILSVALFISLDASAGMRCPGGGLVQTEMDMFQVMELCGPNHGEIGDAGDQGPKRTLWRYRFGAGGFTYILRFKDEILVEISYRR